MANKHIPITTTNSNSRPNNMETVELLPWIREYERLKTDPTVSLVDRMRPLHEAYIYYYMRIKNIINKFEDERNNSGVMLLQQEAGSS